MGSFKFKLVAYFLLLALVPLAAAFWGYTSIAARSQTREADVRLQSSLRSASPPTKTASTPQARLPRGWRKHPGLGPRSPAGTGPLSSGCSVTPATRVEAPHLHLGSVRVPAAVGRRVDVIGPHGRLGVVIAQLPLDASLERLLQLRAGLPAGDRMRLLAPTLGLPAGRTANSVVRRSSLPGARVDAARGNEQDRARRPHTAGKDRRGSGTHGAPPSRGAARDAASGRLRRVARGTLDRPLDSPARDRSERDGAGDLDKRVPVTDVTSLHCWRALQRDGGTARRAHGELESERARLQEAIALSAKRSCDARHRTIAARGRPRRRDRGDGRRGGFVIVDGGVAAQVGEPTATPNRVPLRAGESSFGHLVLTGPDSTTRSGSPPCRSPRTRSSGSTMRAFIGSFSTRRSSTA